VGIYRLIMKKNSDNFRESSILEIINHLKIKGVTIIIYEPLITEKVYNDIPIENNLIKFKLFCDLVITNRMDKDLEDISEKVYTRDLFSIH
jgi:UDPglucose 6-dehydrogenase